MSRIFAIGSFSNRHSIQSLPTIQVECQPEEAP
jgi:hypothetical protein